MTSLTRQTALSQFMARVGARSSLSEVEQQAILALPGDVTRIRANRDLVRLGEVVSQTCLVIDGLMARFGQTRNGLRQISAFYIPGDMPDLHSFVLPKASWTLTALIETTVLRVPHKAIEAITQDHPAIAKAFWRDCTLDAASSSTWILALGRKSARGRMAHLICELAVRYEQIGKMEGLSFPFPISQANVADALGLTPVHVNRTLSALKRAGVVEIKSKQAHILDWPQLVSEAEFEPGYLHLGDGSGAGLQTRAEFDQATPS